MPLLGARDTVRRRYYDALHDASGPPAHSPGPVVQRPSCGGAQEKTEGRGAGDSPLGHVLREAYLRNGSRSPETQLQEGGGKWGRGRARNGHALVYGGGVSIHRVVLGCLIRLVHNCYCCFAACSPRCRGERTAVYTCRCKLFVVYAI